MLPIYNKLLTCYDLMQCIDVEKQVFEEVAPLGTPVPYIVWQAISGQAIQHLDCSAHFDHSQFQIMVYDSDLQRAYRVREIVRQHLEKYCWILNPNLTNYEDDTKLFARGFDANWVLHRTDL